MSNVVDAEVQLPQRLFCQERVSRPTLNVLSFPGELPLIKMRSVIQLYGLRSFGLQIFVVTILEKFRNARPAL